MSSPGTGSSARISWRAKRWSPDLRPCSSRGRTSLVAAKRAAVNKAQAGIPRHKKQPKSILDDPASSAQIRSLKRKPKKRAAASKAEAWTPRREKQPRAILDDHHLASSAQIRSLKQKPETQSDHHPASSAPIHSLKWKPEQDIPGSNDLVVLPPRRPKRTRLDDSAAADLVVLQSILGADDLQFPIWMAKRLRSALGGGTTLNRRDWANIGEGPAGLIAERLLANDVADYIRFRAVCRPWRACSTDPRAHDILNCRFHPRQWVMIRETVTTPHSRRFLNVSTGHCICIDLPELHGHDVFGPTMEGLLVLLHRTTFLVRLLNPLTLQSADLPPATTLLSQIDPKEIYDMKEDFEVSGAGLANDSAFVVNFTRIKTVAVAKPGDERWTVIDHGSTIYVALSFAGRFYCVTNRAVMVVNTCVDQPPQLVMVAKRVQMISRIMMDSVHLVDNGGELMLVYRIHSGSDDNINYQVYRVDLDGRNTVPVHGLGGRAVFIGIERALSVSPSVFPTLRANAIYLGFDAQFTGSMDQSPCHLMDGTAELRDMHNSINDMPRYGPWGVDHYLSCCVTGYGDEAEDT
ncbi:unnamed protein product [Urochloa humidicola]